MAKEPLTESEFKADLDHLHHAIWVVNHEHGIISDEFAKVVLEFNKCRGMWGTPSTASFDAVSAWLSRAGGRLNAVLDDMAMRMQTAYDNYKAAETTNVANLKRRAEFHSDSGSRDGNKKSHNGASEWSVRPSGHGDGKSKLREVMGPPVADEGVLAHPEQFRANVSAKGE
jgi:hypothetical protein